MWTMIIVGLIGLIALFAAMCFIDKAYNQGITEDEVSQLESDADVSGNENPD